MICRPICQTHSPGAIARNTSASQIYKRKLKYKYIYIQNSNTNTYTNTNANTNTYTNISGNTYIYTTQTRKCKYLYKHKRKYIYTTQTQIQICPLQAGTPTAKMFKSDSKKYIRREILEGSLQEIEKSEIQGT